MFIKTKNINLRTKKRNFIILAVILCLIFISLAVLYYYYSSALIHKEKEDELTTIAEMKINQIVGWHRERIADLNVLTKSRTFIKELDFWVKNRNNSAIENEIIQRLEIPRKEYNYQNIFLLDHNGTTILSVGEDVVQSEKYLREYISRPLIKDSIYLTDFYFCEDHISIHYDIISSLTNSDNYTFGYLVFRINPYDHIYPLIQFWPIKSRSAETLLIREDGDHIVYLNELRHQSDTALKLKIPLTETKMPAINAIKGSQGITGGTDYRGIEVLAYLSPIPGTKWFLVAKMDESEILAELSYRALFTFIILGVLIMLVGAGSGWVYNYRKGVLYKRLWQTQDEFKTTLDSITDGVITTDNTGLIKLMNPVAENLLGNQIEELYQNHFSKTLEYLVNNSQATSFLHSRSDLQLKAWDSGLSYCELNTGKGEYIPLGIGRNPILDKKGEVVGYIFVLRDRSVEVRKERELKQSEANYKYLFENNPHPMWVYDLESLRFIAVNDTAIQKYGYSRDEFLSMTLLDIRPKDDKELLIQNIEDHTDIIQSSGPWQHKLKSGQIIFVEIFSHHLEFSGREARLVIANDISDRLTAIEALRNSEEINRVTFEQAAVGIAHVGTDGTWLRVNKKLCDIVGYSEEELRSKTFQEITHPDDLNKDLSLVRQVLEGKIKTYSMEKRYFRKSAGIVWINLTVSLVRDEKNNPLYFISIIEDISERKLFEESLAVRAKQQAGVAALGQKALSGMELAELFDNAVKLVADTFSVEYCKILELLDDKSGLKLISGTGWMPGVVGSSVVSTELLSQAGYTLTSKEPVIVRDLNSETRFKGPDLLLNHKVRSGISVIIGSNEKPFGILGAHSTGLRDFSEEDTNFFRAVANILAEAIERKNFEHKINRLNQELESRIEDRTAQLVASNKELEAFAYSVSHDLRAPLRGIHGFTQILVEDYSDKLDDEGSRMCNIILHNSNKMGQLIDDLLAFSRLSRAELRKTSIDMNELVNNSLQDVKETENYKNYKNIIIDKGNLHPGFGDPRMMHQVWINLLSNSLKFSSYNEEICITIGSSMNQNKCVYFVKDNGAGFDMRYVDKLFGVFQRLHSEKEFKGTGVGLAIVQRIIHKHGGDVWAEGVPGTGATFYFSLPLKEE